MGKRILRPHVLVQRLPEGKLRLTYRFPWGGRYLQTKPITLDESPLPGREAKAARSLALEERLTSRAVAINQLRQEAKEVIRKHLTQQGIVDDKSEEITGGG